MRQEHSRNGRNIRWALKAAGLMVPEPSMSGPMPFIEPDTAEDEVVYIATRSEQQQRVWMGGRKLR